MTSQQSFDIYLMNPPYDRSLHLKFLEKAIQVSENVVSVQPITWMEDPLAMYKQSTNIKKYNNSILEHIRDIDIFTADEATKLFGADFIGTVGIYICNKQKSDKYKDFCYIRDGINYSFIKKITEKIIQDNNFSKMNVETFSDNLHNFVPLNNMTGQNLSRCKPTCVVKEWARAYKNANEYRYDKSHKSGVARGKIENDKCLVFDTLEEAKNCFDSFTQTDFCRFYMSFVTIDVHIYHKLMPFMSSYKEKWTDEKFYKYFGITKEEQKIIENYAKKIWNRLNKNNL